MQDNHFQFQLFMDEGKTGNFEITVFTKADLSDEGKSVYSKQGTGKFPHADASEFETLVNAITAATSWGMSKKPRISYWFWTIELFWKLMKSA